MMIAKAMQSLHMRSNVLAGEAISGIIIHVQHRDLATFDGSAFELNIEMLLNRQLPGEQTFRRSAVQRLASETFESAPRIQRSLLPRDTESQMDSLWGFERHCQFLASSFRNPHSPASILGEASILSIPEPCTVLKET
jgi:hypothetical protein